MEKLSKKSNWRNPQLRAQMLYFFIIRKKILFCRFYITSDFWSSFKTKTTLFMLLFTSFRILKQSFLLSSRLSFQPFPKKQSTSSIIADSGTQLIRLKTLLDSVLRWGWSQIFTRSCQSACRTWSAWTRSTSKSMWLQLRLWTWCFHSIRWNHTREFTNWLLHQRKVGGINW